MGTRLVVWTDGTVVVDCVGFFGPRRGGRALIEEAVRKMLTSETFDHGAFLTIKLFFRSLSSRSR